MKHLEPILNAHPQHGRMENIPGFAALLAACLDCAFVCQSCADACNAQDKPQALLRCSRLDLDCAAICTATASLLARAYEPDGRVLRAQLQACLAVCVACAEECERHAGQHAHCRVCAETCRTCERACQQVMERLPAMAMA